MTGKRKKPEKENVHAGHRKRLRNRFKKQPNFDHFNEHEVLEYMLSFMQTRHDVNPIAHALINHFGSFGNVLEAEPEELEQVKGVGERTACYINAQLAFFRYYRQNRWAPGVKLESTKDWGHYAVNLFIGMNRESFYAIFLNAQKELLGAELINKGNNREVAVYTDLLIKNTLKYNTAVAVIFAHNHPGGTLRPSRNDLDLTKHLSISLSYVMKKTLDHIIVVGDDYYSFLENNIMPDFN